MYEFYSQPHKPLDLKRSRRDLNNLYEDIPETEGCIDNIAKKDGCGAWCCGLQSPQVMFSEFLNSWYSVTGRWIKQDVINLLVDSAAIYLNGKPTNACIFWNQKTKLCRQHETRPFNCRTYGQIPEEEFKPRYERLKIIYENNPDANIKDQCNLIKTKGIAPTSAQIQKWFEELSHIEGDFVKAQFINDHDGGSYRTYHDHILLAFGNEDFLLKLTNIRYRGSEREKAAFLKDMREKLGSQIVDLTKIRLKI